MQFADVPTVVLGLQSARGAVGIAETVTVTAVGTVSTLIAADICADF